MRFFIDEDLSPALVGPCREAGYEATCSRDRDMLGMSDREVAALCLEEERVLASNNAGDFFKLTSASGLHPGLVILPLGSRAQEVEWMRLAIAAVEELAVAAGSTPADEMINAVVEVAEDGQCRSFEYP
jgi:predicted nuclease of predicted toxin-antitoxin system